MAETISNPESYVSNLDRLLSPYIDAIGGNLPYAPGESEDEPNVFIGTASGIHYELDLRGEGTRLEVLVNGETVYKRTSDGAGNSRTIVLKVGGWIRDAVRDGRAAMARLEDDEINNAMDTAVRRAKAFGPVD